MDSDYSKQRRFRILPPRLRTFRGFRARRRGRQGAGAAEGFLAEGAADAVGGVLELGLLAAAEFGGRGGGRGGAGREVEQVQLARAREVLAEGADAEADQAHGMGEFDGTEEVEGHRAEVFLQVRGTAEGALARQGVEALPAELEAAEAGQAPVGAQARGHVVDQVAQRVFEDLPGGFVLQEGVFAGNRLFADVELDLARVLAEGERPKVGGAVGAGDVPQEGLGGVLQVADGMQRRAVERRAHDLPDAPHARDRQRPQERGDGRAVERQHRQAVRLAVFAAELGEELVGVFSSTNLFFSNLSAMFFALLILLLKDILFILISFSE